MLIALTSILAASALVAPADSDENFLIADNEPIEIDPVALVVSEPEPGLLDRIAEIRYERLPSVEEEMIVLNAIITEIEEQRLEEERRLAAEAEQRAKEEAEAAERERQAQVEQEAQEEETTPVEEEAPAQVATGEGRYGVGEPWATLAECESGNWQNGGESFERGSARWAWGGSDPVPPWGTSIHDGGLQFHPNTWSSYKDPEHPARAYDASPQQQVAVAQRVQASQGWKAWPTCARMIGLY